MQADELQYTDHQDRHGQQLDRHHADRITPIRPKVDR